VRRFDAAFFLFLSVGVGRGNAVLRFVRLSLLKRKESKESGVTAPHSKTQKAAVKRRTPNKE
jgi:hypothetical protein